MTVGERIRLVRQSRDMTQKDLADKLGISHVGVNQWENNKRKPKYDTLLSISKALDCNVQFLLDGSVVVNVADRAMEKLCDELGRWCAEGNAEGGQASSYVSMVNGAVFVLHRLGIPCKVQWTDERYHFTSITVAGRTVCVNSETQHITPGTETDLPDSGE